MRLLSRSSLLALAAGVLLAVPAAAQQRTLTYYGDFDPAPSAITVVGGPGAYTWASPALTGDVAAWLADPATNFGWALLGASSQIAATALMLLTMQRRGFGVTTALIKTEPVTLALIGALLLAEPLGPARLAAIATATCGVVLASGANWRQADWGAALLGIVTAQLCCWTGCE